MKSNYLMYALFAQYITLTVLNIVERSLGGTLYWLGAAIIITGAYFLKKGI